MILSQIELNCRLCIVLRRAMALVWTLIGSCLETQSIEDPPVTPANPPVKLVNDPRSKLQSLFLSLMDAKPRQPGKKGGKIEEELRAYENNNWSSNDEFLIKKYGPLLFFKENQDQFPILSRLAKVIFSASPASTPVECVFSTVKQTANPLRNSAKPQQVEDLTFLRQNQLR